jgi:trigger factor
VEFTVEKEKLNYIIDIVIPKLAVDKEMDDIAKSIQPRVDLKGFRKGNVPLNVVKSQFSNVIKAEATTKLLYAGISEALRENNIRNAGNPILLEEYRPTKKRQHVGWFGLDGTLKFKVSVDAPPEVELTNYTDREIETSFIEYESWLSAELFKSQTAFGEKNQVDRAAAIGDEVVIGFTGRIDGEEFEGGTIDDYILVLGQDTFLPEFEAAFIGQEQMEDFKTNMTFPTSYAQPELAGKEVEFDCILKEVYELKVHPLNDDLAMMLSYGTLEDMMSSLKESWVDEFQKPLRMQVFNGLMDILLEENPFDVPENWVNQEMGLTASRMGLEPKQIADNEAIMNSVRELAERSVKISYLVDMVYEREEAIHITAEEIEGVAADEGARIGKSGMEYLDELRKANKYDAFVSFQEQQKAVDFLVENSKLKEK